ncbi:MAG: LacI family DNA-binding transcriptional regulator [Yoonia sp.]
MADDPVEFVGKVTIKHVAKDAGVSVAAVSKVMRNAYGVSDKLRAKVLKSIDKLNYRPSTAAQAMRGRTYTVGVLLMEMTNPFLATVVDGLKTELNEANYKFLIGVGDAQESLEQALIDSMIDMRLDGIVLVAPRLSSELLKKYAKQIPLAVIGHHEPQSKSFDTINSDDKTGAAIAVQALITSGHKRIQMVSLKSSSNTADVLAAREQGYIDAMSKAGLEAEIKILPVRERSDRDGADLHSVLDIDPMPEAFFCWSDLHGVDLLCAAKRRGINVPNELAVIGYDNNVLAQLPLVDLSSVDQNGNKIGRLAAKTLLSRIDGHATAQHLLVEPELVIRSSS